MSKLFDALKRTGEANQDILTIVDDPDQASPDRKDVKLAREEYSGLNTQQPVVSDAVAFVKESAYRLEHLRLDAGTPTLPFDGSASRAAEQYRLIRTRILHDPRNPKVLLLSSPTPGDGKTVTSVNLAAGLALKSDSTVLLIDGDLRRRGIAPLLGIPSEPGLGDVLQGACSLEDAIVKIAEVPGLYVLPAGQITINPTELLDSPKWIDSCKSIRDQFSYTVIDSPPVSSVADYDILEKMSDGVIVVLRPDHSNRSLAFKALESISREKQLGFIINCATEWFLFKPANPYYYYGEYR